MHIMNLEKVVVMVAHGFRLRRVGCGAGDSAALVRRPRGRRLELWSDSVRHALRCLALRRRKHLESLPQDHCKPLLT